MAPIPTPPPCQPTTAGSGGHGPQGHRCTPAQSEPAPYWIRGGLRPDRPACDTGWLGDGRAARPPTPLRRTAVWCGTPCAATCPEPPPPGGAPPFVSLEKDARPIDDPSGALAATDQPLQLVPIFRRQPYRVFLRNHGCRTSRTAVCHSA